jgi:hypothetical protein
VSAIAGWASARGCADPAGLAAMAQALAHRTNGETLSAVIDRSPRRSVVLAASLSDAASRISLSLDGAILNAAELRAELTRRGFATVPMRKCCCGPTSTGTRRWSSSCAALSPS